MKRIEERKHYQHDYDNIINDIKQVIQNLRSGVGQNIPGPDQAGYIDLALYEWIATLERIKFNYAFLDQIAFVLVELEEFQSSYEEKGLKTPELLLDVNQMLVKCNYDFKLMLDTTYKDILSLCKQTVIVDLSVILGGYPWMLDLIKEKKFAIGDLATNEAYYEIVQHLCQQGALDDKSLEKLLNIAIKKSDVKIVQYLLQKGAKSSSVLGTKAYYDSSDEIVDILQKDADKQGNMYGTHYKGMFYYQKGKYIEAIECFKKVFEAKTDVSIVAKLYEGLCYQYEGKYQDATGAFAAVSAMESNYYDKSNICKMALKHKDAITRFNTQDYTDLDSRVAGVGEHLKFLQKYNPDLKNFTERIPESVETWKNSKDQGGKKFAAACDELKKALVQLKYVELEKTYGRNVVLAIQFKDLPNVVDKIDTSEYEAALLRIDKAMDLIGESMDEVCQVLPF